MSHERGHIQASLTANGRWTGHTWLSRFYGLHFLPAQHIE